MAFKLKGGVGGPFRKNYPSAFKHPHAQMEAAAYDGHTHPKESVADPNLDTEKLRQEYQEFEEALGNRSLVGKVMGLSPKQDKQRSKDRESTLSSAQVALSAAGVANPSADALNAGGSIGRYIDAKIGLNRPQSDADAKMHFEAAGYNLAAIAPVIGDAAKTVKHGGKVVDITKGAKDLFKSLTFQGTKATDKLATVGNYGYWFDEDTGTIPTVVNKVKSAFQLGNKPLPGIAREGNINKKHKFKVERTNLEDGVLGEARMDGTVQVDNSVEPGSAQDKKVIAHESVHAEEIASGKIEYRDDYVRDGNNTYHRKDGQIKYNGKWKDEGDSSFPWEKRAIKAEK